MGSDHPQGRLPLIFTGSAAHRGARILAVADAWQRRHVVAAFPIAVVKKFGEDRASSSAALVAYYAFFSLFPLLLAFTSILGFVLQGDPTLQDDIVDSALARIPVIGAQLGEEVQPLAGSTVGLVVGIAGALWAGLGVTLALGRAFDALWDVPRIEQRGAVRARMRGAAVLALLGAALVATTLVSGLAVAGRIHPLVAGVATLAASLAVNAAVFVAMFALLTAGPRQLGDLLPGALVAAAGSVLLQSAGGWYVEHTIAGASATYGTFALVIGLLSWFWLGSHVLLGAAEMNVVRHRRLWPRSLTGELEPADRLAMRGSAAAVRQDPRELISVRFSEDGK